MKWILLALVIAAVVWFARRRGRDPLAGLLRGRGADPAARDREAERARLAAASPHDGAAERLDPAASRLDRGGDDPAARSDG